MIRPDPNRAGQGNSDPGQSQPNEFIWVTKDFSCLGFALKLKSEGYQVLIAYENPDLDKDKEEAYGLVGEGLVECSPLEQVFRKREAHRDAYWVFDSNHHPEYSETLRNEGYKTWGGGKLNSQMEFDREFGVEVAEAAGLDIPETEEFSNTAQAIKFLEANGDRAFVCKPNESESHLTYVPQSETPQSANKELQAYLKSVGEGKSFILQEVIKGVELNIECFFFEGTPYFAWCDLECKRKNSGDKGELTGCSQNISFIVDMDAPIVAHTIGKMFDFYREKNYTGFGDVNCILSDNKAYFIEWCCRFGFNAHPTLFHTLLIETLGNTLKFMIDGVIVHNTDIFYSLFRKGFGAGIQMYLDHPETGFPIHVSKEVAPNFYAYELCQDDTVEDEEQDFYLSGFSQEVGIVFGFNYSLIDAAKKALANALLINFPACAYREDLDQTDYSSSPIKRFEALEAMGLLR